MRVFRRYFPRLKTYRNPKLLTLEIAQHHELDGKFKRSMEKKLRNFFRNLRSALRDNPEQFFQEKFKRLYKSRKPHLYEKVVNLYRNYSNWFKYLIGLEIKTTKNGRYWHYHAIMDLPFISVKIEKENPVERTLTDLWQKQVGSSLDFKEVKGLSEKQEQEFQNNDDWKYIKTKHVSVDESKLRSLWYVTKYITKMDWLNPEEYSWFAYTKNFIQSSHGRDKNGDIIKLGSKRNISPFLNPEVRLNDGSTAIIPLTYHGTSGFGGSPPPNPDKPSGEMCNLGDFSKNRGVSS